MRKKRSSFKPRKPPPGGFPENKFKMSPWDIIQGPGLGPGGSARYKQRKPKKR